LAIKFLDAPTTQPATNDTQKELSFREKLKAVADNPTRQLTLAEKIASSAPGRAILGAMVDVGENPVSRGIASAPANVATSVSDLYLGATQKTYEVVGLEDAAKDVETTRRQIRGIADEIDAFNARQDKLFSGGETMARVMRGASSAVTEALTAGGAAGLFGNASKGNSLLMQYYATRSTQEALRQNPEAWDTAIAHGLIDGISTGLGEYVGLPTAQLAGVPKSVANRMLGRAVSRAKSSVPIPDGALRAIFGASLEAGQEVLTETAHYFADVSAGLEKLDWKKYGNRMAETAATAGLTGASATGVQQIVDTMRQRQEAIPSFLESEMAARNEALLQREIDAGLVEMPALEEAAPAEGQPKPTAEEKAQRQAEHVVKFRNEKAGAFKSLSLDDKLFDLAMREQRVDSTERAATRLQAASKFKPGRQVVDTGPTMGVSEPAEPAKLDQQVQEIADVNPEAATEAATAVPPRDSAIDAELALLADMEAEANALRQELSENANVKSPQREQLRADLDNINATIAERLTQLAEQESAMPREVEKASSATIPPRTRAQRRIDALTKQVNTAKAKTADVRKQFQTRKEMNKQLVKDSLAYVQEALPPSARIGLEAAAAKVDTVGKLDKFIKRVDATVARYEKQLAKKGLAAAMKKAEKYATRPEDRAKVSDILSPVDVSSKRVRERAKQLVDYVKAHPEVGTPAGYTEALEKVNKIGVNELSTPEIRQLAEAIEAVAAEASADNQFRTIARDMTIEQYAENVKSQISVNRPRASGVVGETIAKVSNILSRPESIMAGLSEDLRVLAWENIGVGAQRNQLDYAQRQHDDMRRLLNSKGLSPDRVANKTFQGGSALNAWRYETRPVGGQTLTRSEAMHLYGLMLDPEAAAILREGGAVLEKNKLRKKPQQLAINDGTLREIGEFLGADGREIVEHAFARMNTEMRDAVNAAWISAYNKPLSERSNYFPIRRDSDWVMDTKSPETFIRDLGDAALDGYGEFGITKRRDAGMTSPLEIGDFFDVYTRHIDTTSRIANYMGPVRDFAAVYGRSDVKQAVVNATSEATYEGILEAVKQQVLPVRDPDAFSRASRKLVHGSGAAILGMRVVTPYKNTLGLIAAQSYYQGGGEMLAAATAQAAVPGNVNRMEALLQTYSPVWRQRTGHYLHEATGGMAGESRSFQPSGVPDVTLFHVATADKFAGVIRGFMAEHYVSDTLGIKPNDPQFPVEVAKEWERMLYRTESTSHGLEMSGALRTGRRHGFVGSFTQFGSGSTKTLSLLQSGRNDIRAGRYKQGVKKYASFGASVTVDAMIGAFFAATAAAQEEEFIDRWVASLTRNAPGVGEAVNQSYRYARDKKVFSGPSDSMMTLVADTLMGTADVYKAIENYLTNGLTDEGDPKYPQYARQAADKLSFIVGAVTKLPTEGVKDIYKRTANLFGIEGDDKETLAAAVRRVAEPIDISEPRNKIKAALKTNDDALFIQGLADIYAADPEKFTTATLNRIVDGQFAAVARIESNPELVMQLSDSELRALRYLVDQRKALRQTLQDMVSRNIGQIREIAAKRGVQKPEENRRAAPGAVAAL